MSNVPRKLSEGELEGNFALNVLVYVLLFGVAMVVTSGLCMGKLFSVIGTGTIVGGASALSGAIIGFLFAIPRTLQADTSKPRLNAADPEHENQTWYQANTNLEQISDWLTKIIIGVSLVEMKSIPPLLLAAAHHTSPGLGGTPAAETLAIFILIYFGADGFLIGYFWTRLNMAKALRHADALVEQIRNLSSDQERLSREQRQLVADAKTLNILKRQLEPLPGEKPVDEAELREAVRASSKDVLFTVFRLARDARKSALESKKSASPDPELIARTERTIPVFRALIDAGEISHRTYGQLGYAYMEKPAPDYAKAKEAFDQAIRLRGTPMKDYIYYELNRALAMIRTEVEANEFTRQIVYPPATITAIYSDLDIVLNSGKTITDSQEFEDWMRNHPRPEHGLATQ